MIQKIKKTLDIYIYTKWAKNRYWGRRYTYYLSAFPTQLKSPVKEVTI